MYCYGIDIGTILVRCPPIRAQYLAWSGPMRAQYLAWSGPMRSLHSDLVSVEVLAGVLRGGENHRARLRPHQEDVVVVRLEGETSSSVTEAHLSPGLSTPCRGLF